MGKQIIIRVDGTVEETEVESTSLEDVQGIVGGYIETIPFFDKYNGEPCQAFCDEEGKLKGYELNKAACNEWYKRFPAARSNDFLVGDICVLLGSAMLD